MSQAKRQRVLMIDDEADFLELARRWVEPEYELLALTDGEGLMQKLKSLAPDVIILDLHMPGQDGFQLCKLIRTDRAYHDVPVLFLTGTKEDVNYLKNFKAGGTAYLTKPVSKKQLLASIRELLPGPAEYQQATGGGD